MMSQIKQKKYARNQHKHKETKTVLKNNTKLADYKKRLVKLHKKDEKNIEEETQGKKDRKIIWKNHTEEIVNKENDWDHMKEANIMEGSIEKVAYQEIVILLKAMKLGKAAKFYQVCQKMVSASGKVGIRAMMTLFQHVLDGKAIAR